MTPMFRLENHVRSVRLEQLPTLLMGHRRVERASYVKPGVSWI